MAKQKQQSKTVTLDPADYWQLQALTGRVQKATADARAAVAQARTQHDALMATLATKYPDLVAENTSYSANDADCTLTRTG